MAVLVEGIDPVINRTEDADYLWRINIPKSALSNYLSDAVLNLDYDNVKNEISHHRPELNDAMASLWFNLYQLQA